MTNRETALRNLAKGDIFHAQSPSGASLVCLVTALDNDTISARRVHTQDEMQFDRSTGAKVGNPRTKIDCLTPFPADIHQLFVNMDRRYQELYNMVRNGVELDQEQVKLSPDEKRADLFIDEHVAANPI